MLKFPRKKVGEQGKRNREEGIREKEMKEGIERKGKDQGEKGNEIYLGSILRKERARKKKQRCLACYLNGKNFLSPRENSKEKYTPH